MTKLGAILALVMLAAVLVTPALADNVDLYIKDLNDENSTVRANAALALGEMNDTRAVLPLIQALEDDSSWVRWRAAEALGEIGDIQALEPLIQALKDNNSDVRGSAAYALGELNDIRAVDPLIQALKDNDSDVRGDAAWALGELNDIRAVEPLIQALKDDDSGVRGDAAWALLMLGWQQGTSSIGEGRTFQVGLYNISVRLENASLVVENISIEKTANWFTTYTAKSALYYDNKTAYIAVMRMDGILGFTSQALEDLLKEEVYVKEVLNRSIDMEPGYLLVGTTKKGEAFYGAIYQRQISSGCEIVLIGSKYPLENLLNTIHVEASSIEGRPADAGV